MKHGSLFSGIGGFDLAASQMGWDNVFHCERDAFCQKVLAYHFPNSKLYEDVTTFDGSNYFGRIDILSGGFPCQPFSNAGKRKGTEDNRHLWPSMLRIIREISPRYVLGENVGGLLNWDGGVVFEQICIELENEGYEVLPVVLPACSVNAPHRRDRVFFIAYANGSKPTDNKGANGKTKREVRGNEEGDVFRELLSDGYVTRSEKQYNDFEKFPTISPICRGDDGLPEELDGITFSKWRTESIKAYGNAVVPPLILQIFRSIQEFENKRR
tara:strand:- start:374 stop:1183 length:810 start_codon:yes stop_codon:yes gene_type:complete